MLPVQTSATMELFSHPLYVLISTGESLREFLRLFRYMQTMSCIAPAVEYKIILEYVLFYLFREDAIRAALTFTGTPCSH